MAVRADRPRFHWLPATPHGKWALALGTLAFVALWLPVLPLSNVPIFAVTIAAGALAVYAIVRRGDRALIFFLPIALGGIALLFVAAEIVFPH